MRIALIHNTGAGEGAHSSEDLAQHFRDAGHEVEIHGEVRRDIVEALGTSPDLLMVAGGDGTVSRAARVLFEHEGAERVPLLPLPLGTANNLSRSLGIVDDDAAALARVMDDLERTRLDIGRIKASWGEELFVESVGVGVFGAILAGERSPAIRLTRAIKEAMRAKDRVVEKRVQDFAREVERAEPMRHRIIADGEDLSGEYVFVKIMNIRTIGPRLPLATSADPGDGLFSLLLLPPEERAAFAAYVAGEGDAVGAGASAPPGISRQVREVELSWPESGGHVDDKAWPEEGRWVEGQVLVTMAGSIEVCRPRALHASAK